MRFGAGILLQLPVGQGCFTTIARVVAATADGLLKVVISYAANAPSMEQGELVDQWKDDKVKMVMRLSRLRVQSTPEDLKLLGWNSLKEPLPPECDPDHYFPQYVPTRHKCASPAFTVTWVRKVNSVRDVPSHIRADPPPLTTGLMWATTAQALANPCSVCACDAWTDFSRHSVDVVTPCGPSGRRNKE